MMTVTMTTTVSTTISQQALSIQSDSDNKINDTQVENSTFLINLNNTNNNNNSSNISTSSNSESSRDGTASQYHKIHLASPKSNDEKGLKFQTGKF